MRPTIMRISTGAIAANARQVRARLPERVRMMCVVKADAYGHDAARTAKKLLSAGADAFAVAIVEEARALRGAGIEGMILVLGGAGEESLREAVRVGASQAVYAPWMLEVMQDEASRCGVRAKAHLKIDSGMSRVGVRGDADLAAMLDCWRRCPDVEMEGMFTHFCAADSDPEFTALQNNRFAEALEQVRGAGYAPIAHAAASTALMDPALQYDMVRPGIVLYGTGVPALADALTPAQTLSTRPIRLQRIQPGDTVGYGRTFTAQRETLVMTLPIGYGDGYPRILGNRAPVLVKGRRAPLIGRVCMDMVMADVTDIPGVTLEDEVVLLGRQGEARITPDELAELAQTIPYEIMLGFASRIPVEVVD